MEHDDLRALVGLLARHGVDWVVKHTQAQGMDLPWRVWVVWAGDYDERHAVAIYTSEELAKAHAGSASGLEVEEYPLSRSVPARVAAGEKVWLVELDLANGRQLSQVLWYEDMLDNWQGATERGRTMKQFPDQGDFNFRWMGWAQEAEATGLAEDARQRWVSLYGVALKPVTIPSRVPRTEAPQTIAERNMRKNLEESYKALHQGLEAKNNKKEN